MAGRGVDRRSIERISSVDGEILRALFDFHYLTAEQLTRLRYSPRSKNYVGEHVRRLYLAGYLDRTFGPRQQAAGSVPWVYMLGRKGVRYVRQELELDRGWRSRPSEQRVVHDPFLFHTLALNDVLIAGSLLTQTYRDIQLAGMLHDLVLKRRPVAVETSKGEKLSVIPDAWLDFRLPTQRVCVVFELDRGTVDRTPFCRKIRALVAFSKGPYEQAFGAKGMTIAFATTAGAKRAADMRAWTEAELTSLSEERRGVLFLFRAIAPGALDPVNVFLERTWQQPYRANREALLLPTT